MSILIGEGPRLQLALQSDPLPLVKIPRNKFRRLPPGNDRDKIRLPLGALWLVRPVNGDGKAGHRDIRRCAPQLGIRCQAAK